jgi:hypothetical protein
VRWINERLRVEYNHDTGGGQEPGIMTESERIEKISLAIGIYQERFRARGRGLPWIEAYLMKDCCDQRATLTAKAGRPSSLELE